MSNVKGQIIDGTTGKGIPLAVVDIYPGSDLDATPSFSFQTDENGNYNVTSDAFDTGSASYDIDIPGYYQAVGDPGQLNGTFELNPTTITKVVGVFPIWV